VKKIRLRRYQRIGVNRMDRKFNGRALLADDMGLGKHYDLCLWN
jgi:SNF2 family DNA or RNA helicase